MLTLVSFLLCQYIPAFPIWSGLGSPTDNHDLFIELARQSIFVDGPEIALLQQACLKNKIFASVGFNERSRGSLGCIWNATVLISDDGKILNHHRKIAPTFYEKLTWAPGDGSGLRVVETERLGRIGGLICGENGNSLARYALMSQGEQLHVSCWCVSASPCPRSRTLTQVFVGRPPMFPTRRPGGEGKSFDLLAATRIRVASHCFEAKVFGVICSSFIDQAMRDALVARDPSAADILDNVSPRANHISNTSDPLYFCRWSKELPSSSTRLALRLAMKSKGERALPTATWTSPSVSSPSSSTTLLEATSVTTSSS